MVTNAYYASAICSCRPLSLLRQGSLGLGEYIKRLVGVYAFFFGLIGGPIAYQTFEPTEQVGNCLGSGAVGV